MSKDRKIVVPPVDLVTFYGAVPDTTRKMQQEESDKKRSLKWEANEEVFKQNSQTASLALSFAAGLENGIPDLFLSIERQENGEPITYTFKPGDIEIQHQSFFTLPIKEIKGNILGITREIYLNFPYNNSNLSFRLLTPTEENPRILEINPEIFTFFQSSNS